jgi:3-phenylpropionate/trans-cinnamate dioxygenase ferredoxin reductase subunit
VQNAIDQAKAAAAAILGKPQPYDPVPWFWSDQYDIKLQIAGLADGFEASQPAGDVGAAQFSVEYRRDGKLIAVDAINDGRAHMLSRRRIAEETAGGVVVESASSKA